MWAGSAGRRRSRRCSRFPATRTGTKWASPTTLFPLELAYGIHPDQLHACDVSPIRQPNAVTGLRDVDHFAVFMKFLAPLARGPMWTRRRLQQPSPCSRSRWPPMADGPARRRARTALRSQGRAASSDLLLHRIGDRHGIRQADSTAATDEIRTPALWGLRMRRPLLHDGTAATIEDAIARHAGEADAARQGFVRLDERARSALLAFLQSL